MHINIEHHHDMRSRKDSSASEAWRRPKHYTHAAKRDSQFRRIATALLAIFALAGLALRARSQPALPPPPPEMLNAWHFNDTNFLSFFGDGPLVAQNLTLVSSWEVNAVQMLATNALLEYKGIETNGTDTNIVCDNGTIYLWFLPNWNSGTGPGGYGRLLEMGNYTTNASVGWFSLYFDPKGTNIFFSSQTNGAGATYLTGSVSLNTNEWTFFALTYSPSNSFLYTNGQLCATGTAVSYLPPPSVRSNYFCIGGGSSLNMAQGQFEWLRTYNGPLESGTISNFYQFVLDYYSGGSGPLGPSFPGGGFSPCLTNGPVYLTNIIAAFDTNVGWKITFSIAGGTNAVAYDVFQTPNLVSRNITNSQWTWLGQGYTCYTYTITNQPNSQAFFVLGDSRVDPDADGLSTAYERLVSKTDPNSSSNPDTDGDGMPDAWELAFGTIPTVDDSTLSWQRINYTYDKAGRLKTVAGQRVEVIVVDGEGNVKTAQ